MRCFLKALTYSQSDSKVLSQIGIAVATFTVTNIDDLLILSIYFANPEYKIKSIVLGQYLGITTLIVISFSGLVLGAFLEDQWVSLLGLIPFGIGVKDLFQLKSASPTQSEELPSKKSKYQFLNVALITVANGGDNIGVYAPVFANLEVRYISVYIMVFLVLTALWCLLAHYFVSHHKVKRVFSKYGKIILPVFLILLGLLIMKDFGLWLIS